MNLRDLKRIRDRAQKSYDEAVEAMAQQVLEEFWSEHPAAVAVRMIREDDGACFVQVASPCGQGGVCEDHDAAEALEDGIQAAWLDADEFVSAFGLTDLEGEGDLVVQRPSN